MLLADLCETATQRYQYTAELLLKPETARRAARPIMHCPALAGPVSGGPSRTTSHQQPPRCALHTPDRLRWSAPRSIVPPRPASSAAAARRRRSHITLAKVLGPTETHTITGTLAQSPFMPPRLNSGLAGGSRCLAFAARTQHGAADVILPVGMIDRLVTVLGLNPAKPRLVSLPSRAQ